MGDYIEGIDGPGGPTGVVFYHRDVTPYRHAYEPSYSRSSSDNSGFATWCFAMGLLFAGMALGGTMSLLFWASSDAGKFAESVEGKCFETVAGAKGFVDESVGTTKVKLVFPSGMRETYPVKKLSEIPCAPVSDATNFQKTGDE